LNRVVPPVLPPAPAAAAKAAQGDAAEISVDEDRAPQKKQEVLFLSATVYDRQVTEVRCFAGQREIKIYTNIDFNLLAGQGGFEADDTVYTLLLGLRCGRLQYRQRSKRYSHSRLAWSAGGGTL